jgi:hypothetical protein
MNRLWLLAALLACSCTRTSTATQDEVNSLVRHCGLAGKMELKWIGGDKLTMTRLDADTGSQEFMCFSRGLEVRGIKLGFEGHERLNR